MAESTTKGEARDRKLGDEWTDWKGEADPGDREIDENISTFLLLSGAVLAGSIGIALFAWFMIKPRLDQISVPAAGFAGRVAFAFVAVFAAGVSSEVALLLKKGKSFLPYALIEKFLLFFLPRAIWLGAKLGISKDRVGNSFLKMHNEVTKSHIGKLCGGRLLVLLPRCLKKEARTALSARLTGKNFKVYTAAGGEEARQAIREYRPNTILAIACERDLMSGIRDIAEKIPVMAVPNKRPEGPCKNTEFSLPQLEDALEALRAAGQG